MGPGADGGGAPGGPDMGGGGDAMSSLMAAQNIAPQVLAQQQTEYYKRFLGQIVSLLRKFSQMPTIGPHTQIDVNRAVTQLQAAVAKMDKEKPENADPVQSLLASSLMQPGSPQGATGAPQSGLAVQGPA